MANHIRCSTYDELSIAQEFLLCHSNHHHNFYLLFKKENNKKKIKYSAQFSLSQNLNIFICIFLIGISHPQKQV
jgi:hypothetical protein